MDDARELVAECLKAVAPEELEPFKFFTNPKNREEAMKSEAEEDVKVLKEKQEELYQQRSEIRRLSKLLTIQDNKLSKTGSQNKADQSQQSA